MVVLRSMIYDGGYPPMVNKQLNPYLRLLAHTLVMCVAGNKGGSDQLSGKLTFALTINWNYSYSRYII